MNFEIWSHDINHADLQDVFCLESSGTFTRWAHNLERHFQGQSPDPETILGLS